jgi:3',5'-cyclic AMP phosphodiesterase CpdA
MASSGTSSPPTLKRSRSHSPDPTTSSSNIDTPVSKKFKLETTTAVKYLIVSDTHDAEMNLLPCDVLLHCGDLTEDGSPSSLRKALQSIGKAKAELKLVIAGNHEISLDEQFYLSEGGSEKDILESTALISTDPDSEAS